MEPERASSAKQMPCMSWFQCKHLVRKAKPGVTMAGGAWFPQEIVDQIVVYISDHRPTLFTCTHLSRTWCIAARTHLYRTFTFSDSAGFKAVDDLQQMETIHLVHRVVAIRRTNQTDPLLSPKALARLNVFTHLQELDFRYLDIGELILRLQKRCDILRSTIRTLTLRYPTGSVKRIVCFISLFSNLENLAVDSINRVVTDDSEVPVIECSVPLTGRLRLSGIWEQEFICDLASMRKQVRFHTVDLRFCREAQEIIDQCAGTMERLIWHSFGFIDIMALGFSRFYFLRHVEAEFEYIVHAFPDHPFYQFVSAISSPRLETCLILSYSGDLDRLRQTLQTTSKDGSEPTLQRGEENPRRNVRITFGLDLVEEGAEGHRFSVWAALDCAIGNGVFDFLNNTPNLEVYIHQAAQ